MTLVPPRPLTTAASAGSGSARTATVLKPIAHAPDGMTITSITTQPLQSLQTSNVFNEANSLLANPGSIKDYLPKPKPKRQRKMATAPASTTIIAPVGPTANGGLNRLETITLHAAPKALFGKQAVIVKPVMLKSGAISKTTVVRINSSKDGVRDIGKTYSRQNIKRSREKKDFKKNSLVRLFDLDDDAIASLKSSSSSEESLSSNDQTMAEPVEYTTLLALEHNYACVPLRIDPKHVGPYKRKTYTRPYRGKTELLDSNNVDSGYSSDGTESPLDLQDILDEMELNYAKELKTWPPVECTKADLQMITDDLVMAGEKFFLFEADNMLNKCDQDTLSQYEHDVFEYYIRQKRQKKSTALPKLTEETVTNVFQAMMA